tara:strand:- start:6761 stop:7204 length:444 start_codon:yes stop_codon:yes gene_type:complete
MARKSSIRGRSNLRRKLQQILPKEIKKSLNDKIEHAGMLIYNEAKRNAPVDEGDLRDGIHIKKTNLAVKLGYWKKGNTRKYKKVGWRANFTEYGTRGGKSKNGVVLKPRKAIPFLSTAYRSKKEQAARVINKAVDSALKKVANGKFN